MAKLLALCCGTDAAAIQKFGPVPAVPVPKWPQQRCVQVVPAPLPGNREVASGSVGRRIRPIIHPENGCGSRVEYDLKRYRHVVRRVAFVAAGLSFLALGVGLHDFLQRVPGPRVINAGIDAVVVLTGGHGRVGAGYRLLEAHPEARLLISGVGAGVRTADLVVPPDILSRVDLGRTATDTVGNAVESRRWARAHRFTRVVLVTSDLHLPRSLLLFGYLAPEIKVVPYPVPGPGSSSGGRSFSWYAAALTEYSKFLVTQVALTLGGPDWLAVEI